MSRPRCFINKHSFFPRKKINFLLEEVFKKSYNVILMKITVVTLKMLIVNQ